MKANNSVLRQRKVFLHFGRYLLCSFSCVLLQYDRTNWPIWNQQSLEDALCISSWRLHIYCSLINSFQPYLLLGSCTMLPASKLFLRLLTAGLYWPVRKRSCGPTPEFRVCLILAPGSDSWFSIGLMYCWSMFWSNSSLQLLKYNKLYLLIPRKLQLLSSSCHMFLSGRHYHFMHHSNLLSQRCTQSTCCNNQQSGLQDLHFLSQNNLHYQAAVTDWGDLWTSSFLQLQHVAKTILTASCLPFRLGILLSLYPPAMQAICLRCLTPLCHTLNLWTQLISVKKKNHTFFNI